MFEMVYNDTTKKAERQQAIALSNIGVTLLENGKAVSWRNYDNNTNGNWNENTGILLTGMLGQRRKV